jgi:hypothetical protein
VAYLVFVIVVPILGTGGATAFLTGAFGSNGQPHRLRIVGAAFLLVATGLWVLVTAAGGGYAGALGAVHELIVASAVALVGAAILILKPPAARRVAAVMLVTAYPMLLVGFALTGSMLAGR